MAGNRNGRNGMQVTVNYGGLANIRKSPAVMAELERRAAKVQAAAESGMQALGLGTVNADGKEHFPVDKQITSSGGKGRARTSVRTHTTDAVRAEATDHVLSRIWKAAARA